MYGFEVLSFIFGSCIVEKGGDLYKHWVSKQFSSSVLVGVNPHIGYMLAESCCLWCAQTVLKCVI